MRRAGRFAAWLAAEYMTDMRDSRARVYDAIVKNNLHLNTVILTVSIASLTAVAALNDKVFADYPALSLMVVALFLLVTLLSTINFYLSGVVLRDIQKNLSKDVLFPFRVGKGKYNPKYQTAQKIINILVLYGFCLGLLVFLILLGRFIMEAT